MIFGEIWAAVGEFGPNNSSNKPQQAPSLKGQTPLEAEGIEGAPIPRSHLRVSPPGVEHVPPASLQAGPAQPCGFKEGHCCQLGCK